MNSGPFSHSWSFGSFVCVRSSPPMLWQDLPELPSADAETAARIQVAGTPVETGQTATDSMPATESDGGTTPRLHAA